MDDRREEFEPAYEPPRIDDLGTLEALCGTIRGGHDEALFSRS